MAPFTANTKNTFQLCKDLRKALISHDFETIRSIYAIEKFQINARDSDDGTIPLFEAIAESGLEVLQFLINLNVNLNMRDENGATALHICVKNAECEEDFRRIIMLMEAGAPEDAQDNEGRTPLMYATGSRVVALLVNGETNLDDQYMNLADTEVKDKYGKTARHIIKKNPTISSSQKKEMLSIL